MPTFGKQEVCGPEGGPLPVTLDGGITLPTIPASTPTTTSIISTTTSATVLEANANRRGLMISNQSASRLYLSFSAPATQANSFILMDPNSFLLLDQQLIITNAIYGIWTSANGTAQVTELL